MNSVFDPSFSGSPRAEMYRAWVHPEIYPKEPQPVLQNWSKEDLEMFCGTIKETSEVH